MVVTSARGPYTIGLTETFGERHTPRSLTRTMLTGSRLAPAGVFVSISSSARGLHFRRCIYLGSGQIQWTLLTLIAIYATIVEDCVKAKQKKRGVMRDGGSNSLRGCQFPAELNLRSLHFHANVTA